jgi:hypothetical protein
MCSLHVIASGLCMYSSLLIVAIRKLNLLHPPTLVWPCRLALCQRMGQLPHVLAGTCSGVVTAIATAAQIMIVAGTPRSE